MFRIYYEQGTSLCSNIFQVIKKKFLIELQRLKYLDKFRRVNRLLYLNEEANGLGPIGKPLTVHIFSLVFIFMACIDAEQTEIIKYLIIHEIVFWS